MKSKGSDLLVASLLAHGVQDFFYIIGGPMTPAMGLAVEKGIRGIDVRDEHAATYAAIAYSRIARRPGVVMTCSGPGTINTITGVAHAFADGAPVVVIGGSAAQFNRGSGAFQEADQVGIMRPTTKWAHQVADPDGVPLAISRAFQIAMSGAPGPVYVDMSADVLYGESEKNGEEHTRLSPVLPTSRTMGDPDSVSAAVDLIEQASRPIVVAGSGVLWSEAWEELRELVEVGNIPFYATPIAKGLIPEDHDLSFPAARSKALREADCVIVVGTRDNYVFNFFQPPVMSGDSSLIMLNNTPAELSGTRVPDVTIEADAKLGLIQLIDEIKRRGAKTSYEAWTSDLADRNTTVRAQNEAEAQSDEVPIHPSRLCAEIARLIPREAILVSDGSETISFARHRLLSYLPGTTLTPGAFGTMGVGIPFGLGAKAAASSSQVVVLTGDGAFGYHAMEFHTAARHNLGFLCVIANNGGWGSNRDRPGYSLGYPAYEHIADVFGCFGMKVTEPADLAPAISKGLAYVESEQKPALLNVVMSIPHHDRRHPTRHARSGDSSYDEV